MYKLAPALGVIHQTWLKWDLKVTPSFCKYLVIWFQLVGVWQPVVELRYYIIYQNRYIACLNLFTDYNHSVHVHTALTHLSKMALVPPPVCFPHLFTYEKQHGAENSHKVISKIKRKKSIELQNVQWTRLLIPHKHILLIGV